MNELLFSSFMQGFGGSQQGVAGASNPNPWSVAAQDGAGQLGQQQLQGVNQAMEFGTTGMPPSLQAQLSQEQQQTNQLVQQTPQAEFGQFYQTDGMVLPPRQQGPEVMPIQPVQQQYSAGGGAQLPQAMPFTSAANMGAPQQGFNPYNISSAAPASPGNDQGFTPNMFLRMSDGYNRGGLLGALGMLLTDYK